MNGWNYGEAGPNNPAIQKSIYPILFRASSRRLLLNQQNLRAQLADKLAGHPRVN